MKYLKNILLIFSTLILIQCSTEDETILLNRVQESKVLFSGTPQTTSGLRVFLFNSQKKLVEEQYFNEYPSILRSPVDSFYFTFVANAMNSKDIPKLKVGETHMDSIMHYITMQNDSSYTEPGEYYLYTTPAPIELNAYSTLNVPLKRSVGLLDISFIGNSSIEAVYVNIEKPVTSINFNGNTVKQETNYSMRKRLTAGGSNKFTGNIIGFPQTDAKVSFDVIYSGGLSQNYPINEPVDIIASTMTTINTQLSSTLSSIINYTTWANNYTINYYAGFQVEVTVDAGNPDNYTGIDITLLNNTTSTTSTFTNLPLVNVNGKLMFSTAQFIGNGNYTVTAARLVDRDGTLFDPNMRGVNMAVNFNVPGRAAVFSLDGRQNEEEYYVRKVIEKMHGTATAGSIYPGTATYATRCVPSTLPTSAQGDGTVVSRWVTNSVTGGGQYYIQTQVNSGEWRVNMFSFLVNGGPFGSALVDSRFVAGGGRFPTTEFYPFLYLQAIQYAQIDLFFGNDLTWLPNIKRLNNFIINNNSITNANKYNGQFPVDLGNLDMQTFWFSYTNLTDTLPASYGNWINLTGMNIGGNAGLTGTLPSSWSNFLLLGDFRIHSNNLTGKIPESFAIYGNTNAGVNFNGNRFTCGPAAFINRYTVNVTGQQTGALQVCTYP